MRNQFLSETSEEVSPYVAASLATTTREVIQNDAVQNGVMQPEGMQTLAATQTAAELVARAQGKIQRRRKKFWAGLAVSGGMYLLTSVLIGLTWMVNAAHEDNSRSYFYVLALLPLLLAAILMAWTALIPVDVDFEELARAGDVSAVPMLIDAINLNVSSRYRRRVTRALTILLPLLKASDAPLLTPLRRYTLNVMLGSCFQPHLRGVDEDFTLAILKAYEQVGDARALPVVERIAHFRPRDDGQRAIQQAAEECLPHLRATIGDVNHTQTLLRASTRQANTPDTLLRSAASTSSTLPAELLRVPPTDDAPSI